MDAALAQADHIVENTYQMNPYDHVPVETQTCVVKPEPDGRLTVHSNTQALYFTKDNMGIILKMPDYKIRLVGGTVGGGFGGKVDVVIEPVTAIAAMKTGRPVKWRWTRTEEFRNSSTVGMYRMTYKDGVMNDGRIIARKVISHHDAGAYHRHSPYGVQKHAFNLAGPYNIPNVYIAAHCVYTNRQPVIGAARFWCYARFVRHRSANGQNRAHVGDGPVANSFSQRLSQWATESRSQRGGRRHAD